MPTRPTDPPSDRAHLRVRGWNRVGIGLGMLLAALVTLAPAQAQARDRLVLSAPRLQTPPPNLHLQPESARLVLQLPVELMPQADTGRLGQTFDPNKYWDIGKRVPAHARLGQGLGLSVSDPRHAVQFQLSVMPRVAVAILRFDFLGAKLH